MEPAGGRGRVTRLQARRNRVEENGGAEESGQGGRPRTIDEGERDESSNDGEPVARTTGEAASTGTPPFSESDDSRDDVSVINGSDSDDGRESDIECLTETDDSSNGNRRQSPASPTAGHSRHVAISSPSVRLSNLSNLAQLWRSQREPQQIVEVDLVENNADVSNAIQNDANLAGGFVRRREQGEVEPDVELDSDSDDDVEVLREDVSQNSQQNRANVPAPNEDDDLVVEMEIIDVGVVREIIRDPEVVQIPPSPEPQEENQNGDDENHDGVAEPILDPSPGISAVNNSEQNNENQDSDNDSADDEGPPQKMPRLDDSRDEDDGCHICYEPYGNSGGHRPCCLKCGHIFGKDCIERWIKAQKRCPDCNCKATPKDMRIIYVKSIRPIDTAELDRMKGENDRLKIEKNRVEVANVHLRCQLQAKDQELARVKALNETLSRSVKESTGDFKIPEPTSSASTMELASTSSSSSAQFSGLRMPRLQIIKKFVIKEGQARVGAYNEWMNLLVVSHAIKSALYPGGMHGIKKINCLDMKPFQSFPIHQRPIRDMAFSPLQNDLLLTVSLDKKAQLFNCTSNCTVQTFNTPASLWSCCWNSVSQNIFYVGSVTGQVTSYDIRAPQEPLNNLSIPTTERSSVARLKFVPPAYQSQSFNMSGLLIQKMSSVWFSEMLGGGDTDHRYHQLPLEGPFLNVDFEPGSRHILVSARPKIVGTQRHATSHMICNLGKTYSEAEERDVFSCEIAQVMTGGFQESAIMCRSALFSPQQGQVYVAGNGETAKTVRVWDVANVEQKTLVKLDQDVALDFVPGSINDTKFLGVIMEKEMDVFGIK